VLRETNVPNDDRSIVVSISASGTQTIEELPDVLDLEDVADLLRVHQKTVRLMALDGKIPAFRAGRLWRFKKSKIVEWLNSAA
jgi:excisionase family DNA binding protein